MRKIVALISLLFLMTYNFHAQKNVYQAIIAHHVIKMPIISRTELVDYAKTFLGTDYCHGSADPTKGFDCSGFVSFVFHHFNITLPHSSKAYENLGVEKKPTEFEVGDILVFYGYKDRNHVGHVGIICEADGMNSKFIHASSGKVKEVTISELNSTHYTERFYKCIDVIH